MTVETEAGSVTGTEGAPAPEVESTVTAPAETQDTTEQPEAEPEEKSEEEEKPKRQDWRDKRIAQLTARKAALEAEVSALGAKANGREPDAQDIDRIVEQRAEEMDRNREALKAANRTAAKGAEAFPDWEEARTALINNFGQEIGARPDFLEAVTSLDHGHAVFRHLGLNPDEADRILSLTPHKMGLELAKLEVRITAKPDAKPIAVSKAPKPIKPLAAASAAAEPDPSKMSGDEYLAWRRSHFKR